MPAETNTPSRKVIQQSSCRNPISCHSERSEESVFLFSSTPAPTTASDRPLLPSSRPPRHPPAPVILVSALSSVLPALCRSRSSFLQSHIEPRATCSPQSVLFGRFASSGCWYINDAASPQWPGSAPQSRTPLPPSWSRRTSGTPACQTPGAAAHPTRFFLDCRCSAAASAGW